jgi:replication factor C subunit 2/4
MAGFVNADNVYRVCDQPHPVAIRSILAAAIAGRTAIAVGEMDNLWKLGERCA